LKTFTLPRIVSKSFGSSNSDSSRLSTPERVSKTNRGRARHSVRAAARDLTHELTLKILQRAKLRPQNPRLFPSRKKCVTNKNPPRDIFLQKHEIIGISAFSPEKYFRIFPLFLDSSHQITFCINNFL
jgi:hypothetical protein